MSRSYKHVAGWTDKSAFGKKEANGRVRRAEEVPNGKAYRKVYCSYNICDFKTLLFTNADKRRVDWIPPYKTRMK